MTQQIDMIVKIVAVIGGVVALLGLPKLVPSVKRFWQMREVRGVLKRIEVQLKQKKKHAKILKELHATCVRAYRICKIENFSKEEELARKLLLELTESRLGLVNDELKKSSTKLQLHALAKECDTVLQTTEENNFELLEDQARELQELVRGKLRYPVRFFFTGMERFDTDLCASHLLRQNQIQDLFRFEIGHLGYYDDSGRFHYNTARAAERFKCLPTDSLRMFTQGAERIIAETEKTRCDSETNRVVITEQALPGNYYLWGHFSGDTSWEGPYNPDRFWVVSPTSLRNLLPGEILPIPQAILRIVQRISVLSLVRGLEHKTTYGCLFDMTNWLPDAQYFVRNAFICEECRSKILKAKTIPQGQRTIFLNKLDDWLRASSATLDAEVV